MQYSQPFTHPHAVAKNATGLNWSSVYSFSIQVFGEGTDYRPILFSPEMLGMNDETHFYQMGFNNEQQLNEEWLGFMITTARLSATELYLIPNLTVVQRPK